MIDNRLIYFKDEVVQAICKGREPWFLVQDLGRLLKIKNIKKNMKEIPAEEKNMCYATVSLGGFKEQRRRMLVVNEAGMYRLILMSRTEEAKKFKTWIVREVLSSIRKTGKYVHKKDTQFFEAKGSNPGRAAFNTLFRPLEWIDGPSLADEIKEAQDFYKTVSAS